jgi:hypothetical protein
MAAPRRCCCHGKPSHFRQGGDPFHAMLLQQNPHRAAAGLLSLGARMT